MSILWDSRFDDNEYHHTARDPACLGVASLPAWYQDYPLVRLDLIENHLRVWDSMAWLKEQCGPYCEGGPWAAYLTQEVFHFYIRDPSVAMIFKLTWS